MTADRTRSVPPPLPGECVPIPIVCARARGLRGEGEWLLETHRVDGLDLDGCGSPVVLVPPDRQDLNPNAVWWRLFIQRGDCGHELGIVIGMQDPAPAPGASCGLRNFAMLESVPPDAMSAPQGIGETIYVFDGVRYVGGRTEQR